MRTLLLVLSVLFCQAVSATGPALPEYYGSEFYQGYQSGTLKDQALLTSLFKILSSNHKVLGYNGARKVMFGDLFLEKVGGAWAVKDVYCETTYTSQNADIGPGKIPSANQLNTEHTWPQSRFTSRFPKEMQKSDLHHLFPTDSEMNSRRGALRFGEVQETIETLKCPIAELGRTQSGELVFEVPRTQKGNTARAIFYFATRYQMKLSPTEEADLRRWHEQDPVDEEESIRNDKIQKVQGDRNPFVDFPDLVSRVQRFQYQ